MCHGAPGAFAATLISTISLNRPEEKIAIILQMHAEEVFIPYKGPKVGKATFNQPNIPFCDLPSFFAL